MGGNPRQPSEIVLGGEEYVGQTYAAWLDVVKSEAHRIDKSTGHDSGAMAGCAGRSHTGRVQQVGRRGRGALRDTAAAVRGLTTVASEHPVLHWDMLRARHRGRIVHRHLAGLLRIVRGQLFLKSVSVPALG